MPAMIPSTGHLSSAGFPARPFPREGDLGYGKYRTLLSHYAARHPPAKVKKQEESAAASGAARVKLAMQKLDHCTRQAFQEYTFETNRSTSGERRAFFAEVGQKVSSLLLALGLPDDPSKWRYTQSHRLTPDAIKHLLNARSNARNLHRKWELGKFPIGQGDDLLCSLPDALILVKFIAEAGHETARKEVERRGTRAAGAKGKPWSRALYAGIADAYRLLTGIKASAGEGKQHPPAAEFAKEVLEIAAEHCQNSSIREMLVDQARLAPTTLARMMRQGAAKGEAEPTVDKNNT